MLGALVRRLVVTGVVVGAMASLTIGTFASFAAQTTNPGSGFVTGTLVLSNTKQGGSACLSTGGGSTDTNANGSCDQLFAVSARKPGDTAAANLTLRNAGTLAGSALKAFVSGGCTDADAAGETYHGTGSPCGKLQLYLQEYSDSGFTTPLACRYGGSSDGGTTCDFSDATKTIGAFATAYPSNGSALTLPGGVAAGASRYIRVGVQLPASSDNSYQGRQASAGLDWYLEQ